MENSRERKLRAIERWRSRKEQKDDCDDGPGFEVGSKKPKGEKILEIDSKNGGTPCVSPKVETSNGVDRSHQKQMQRIEETSWSKL